MILKSSCPRCSHLEFFTRKYKIYEFNLRTYYILKTVKRQFYCIIMSRYFSRMHKEKGSGRALGFDLSFQRWFIFVYLLLARYFRILILYTTDFNPRINKDIITIEKRPIVLFQSFAVSVVQRCCHNPIYCLLLLCPSPPLLLGIVTAHQSRLLEK